MSASDIQHLGEQQGESTVALDILNRVFREYPVRNFAVRLWDGSVLDPEAGQDARFTLVILNPAAFHMLLEAPSELALGEAYIHNYIDIEGEIEAAMSLVDYLLQREFKLLERLRLGGALRRLRSVPSADVRENRDPLRGIRHSVRRDREAVRYHYDVSNEFYRLWLDRRMVYSEAQYEADDDLDRAQLRKLDSICEMLQLRRGERFLDIGCGWGGLIIHAAKNYGVNAVGITLSKLQAEFAEERICGHGLAKLCRVLIKDYRELGPKDVFEKIASIGMVEHVGSKMLGEFFARVHSALCPGGLFVLSGITQPIQRVVNAVSESFIDQHVFPDGELLPISQIVEEAERAGFEVRSVRSVREQYARTLRDWVRRLEEHAEQARRLTSDVTYRIWRLYMAGSAHRFSTGALNVHQMVLAKAE